MFFFLQLEMFPNLLGLHCISEFLPFLFKHVSQNFSFLNPLELLHFCLHHLFMFHNENVLRPEVFDIWRRQAAWETWFLKFMRLPSREILFLPKLRELDSRRSILSFLDCRISRRDERLNAEVFLRTEVDIRRRRRALLSVTMKQRARVFAQMVRYISLSRKRFPELVCLHLPVKYNLKQVWLK